MALCCLLSVCTVSEKKKKKKPTSLSSPPFPISSQGPSWWSMPLGVPQDRRPTCSSRRSKRMTRTALTSITPCPAATAPALDPSTSTSRWTVVPKATLSGMRPHQLRVGWRRSWPLALSGPTPTRWATHVTSRFWLTAISGHLGEIVFWM